MTGSSLSTPFLFVDETPRTLGLRPGPAWMVDPVTGMTRYFDLHGAPPRHEITDDMAGN